MAHNIKSFRMWCNPDIAHKMVLYEIISVPKESYLRDRFDDRKVSELSNSVNKIIILKPVTRVTCHRKNIMIRTSVAAQVSVEIHDGPVQELVS